MNKTTEALKLAEEALEDAYRRDEHAAARWVYEQALAAIRETLAEPVTISCDCGDIYERNSFGGKFIQQYGCCPNCDAAKPVKQEPVASVVAMLDKCISIIGTEMNHCKQAGDKWFMCQRFVHAIQDMQYEFKRDYAAPVSAPEQEDQEPVAWAYFDADGSFMDALDRQHGAYQTPLYAAQVSAKREWVDLTDDEIAILIHRIPNKFDFARAVIAAFKDKNK